MIPAQPPPPPTSTHAQFADAPQRCTWVDELGVRCTNPPVMGSPTSSSCEQHRPAPITASPSVPLTAEESISAPTLDAPAVAPSQVVPPPALA